MKSAKSMLALAKANAISKGIRAVDFGGRTYIGYLFTSAEISDLYRIEGFLHRTMHKHVEAWVETKQVIPVGKVYFVLLSQDDVEQKADLVEERSMRSRNGDLDCVYVSEATA